MITLRRAILQGPDRKLTVLDCGHGVYFEIVDKWGQKLAQETIKFRKAIACIEDMNKLAASEDLSLDVFNQFMSQVLASGYKLEDIPEADTEESIGDYLNTEMKKERDPQ